MARRRVPTTSAKDNGKTTSVPPEVSSTSAEDDGRTTLALPDAPTTPAGDGGQTMTVEQILPRRPVSRSPARHVPWRPLPRVQVRTGSASSVSASTPHSWSHPECGHAYVHRRPRRAAHLGAQRGCVPGGRAGPARQHPGPWQPRGGALGGGARDAPYTISVAVMESTCPRRT